MRGGATAPVVKCRSLPAVKVRLNCLALPSAVVLPSEDLSALPLSRFTVAAGPSRSPVASPRAGRFSALPPANAGKVYSRQVAELPGTRSRLTFAEHTF